MSETLHEEAGRALSATPTVHVSIGNSDDRLPQAEWADYRGDVDRLLRVTALEGHVVLHGAWVSESSSPFQNASWAFTPHSDLGDWDGPGGLRQMLRESLQALATIYQQDSIAWGEADTEFLTGLPGATSHPR